MKRILCTMLTLGAVWVSSSAQSIEELVSRLRSVECYQGQALIELTMPLQGVDVAYDVDLLSMPSTAADSLNEVCDFLIQWQNPKAEGVEKRAFTASIGGDTYTYRGERLRHDQGGGRFAQFTMLLPQFIGEKIATALADKDCLVEMTHDDENQLIVYVVETLGSEEVGNAMYLFDEATLMPLEATLVNNPGGVGEQVFKIEYYDDYAIEGGSCDGLTLEYLTEIYPEVFSLYGNNDFDVVNLTGMRFPSFSLPTIDMERSNRDMKDGFDATTYVVFVNPTDSTTSLTIDAVRQAKNQIPRHIETIWAFVEGNHDDVANVIDSGSKDELILMNADGLAQKCGANHFPVIVVADEDGVVRYVSIGYNQGLASKLIYRTELIDDK
ncbi:MAG: hypothetical protein IJ342_03845 [Muribaculaceae bacterium]|nr:hypothetical protein [Muribaculaceae bacterium]MBQ7851994.1 hypothetical protein [Muribaculaceae bacterium]